MRLPAIKPTLRSLRAQWQLYTLILPAVVYLVLFSYVPMHGIQIAFRNFRPSRGIWGSDWVGLKYFLQFIAYPNFGRILANTAVISLYSLATFPLGIVLALLMNELNSIRFRKIVQMVTYAPHFISTVVVCSMIMLFLNRSNGLVNNILAALGRPRVAFMEVSGYFASIYVWSGVWQTIGWNTIMYIAALSSVPLEQVEAACIDGASRAQVIRHVNIPCILPTVIITLILRCGSLLAVGFNKIYLLQNSLNLEVSQVISTYVYELGLRSGQYSYATAINLFNTLVNIAFLLLVNAIARRVSEISLW